ncbi:Xyloglucan galactosyltransferase KATAMARI [Rhynchospora pubera]|uniref:Xyloglucan galactosyltransferase KATAMARI n=1 Tax=Rhynchospora pubera TaxID=906938 RepID=A0AAV8HHX1_9POAL|nr:Xyloglucan galactosyltransferase KATAMARI [Rhynchospora pubera]
MYVKVLVFCIFFSVATYSIFPYCTSDLDLSPYSGTQKAPEIQSIQCDPDIAPFYIYDLPERFNEALLSNCSNLDPWVRLDERRRRRRKMGRKKNYKQFKLFTKLHTSQYFFPLLPFFPSSHTYPNAHHGGICALMLKTMAWANHLTNQASSWYNTFQFTADLIFHARAINHPCRTHDRSSALMFYIPFYASLYASSVSNENNLTRRDAMAVDLVDHISKIPSDAGSLVTKRLSTLLQDCQVKAEITTWQGEVRHSKRTHLFSFVGGARHKGHGAEKYRSAVISQCNSTDSCLLVLCKYWTSAWDAADEILGAMKQAHFCLQPPGDTSTRRSIFDSILAGCVPVFFTELTAYSQYTWYIPERREDWSVLIGPDQLDRIEDVLSQIPEKEVKQMREVVIRMIPQVTYMHPKANSNEVNFRDAVDVALVELTKRALRINTNSV